MTATFLQSELSSLIQDSKKKYPDVRIAAEKSLSDLKSLSVTSETQLAGDLVRRAYFIDPFIIACKSQNVKLAGSGVVCLQRLTASRAIPPERLTNLLDAFHDVVATTMDIQLKILQTLPSLLQLYEGDLKDALLAATLEVCGTLQSSKTGVISNTAAATFQQLTTTVFERVEDDDRIPKGVEDEQQNFGARSDAIRLLRDLCALANNEQPEFVQIKAMSSHFLLEVIGSILTNHENIFSNHPETIEICRTKLMPAVVNLLAAKINFPLAVRVLRIIYVLISRHLDAMHEECDKAVSAMVRCLDPDQNPIWKRILCMEVFRAICQEAALLPRMFELFDQHERKSGAIVGLLAAFVRIASEDPSLIGLGRQSTVPSRRGASGNHEDIMIETAGIGGAIGSVVSADSTVTGISMEWSVARTPYMEQLDKSEASDVPSTYIYSLIINCLVAIAEGLSKFVMPLSVPSKGQSQRIQEVLEDNGALDSSQQEISTERIRPGTPGAHKYQRLLNPLNLKDHPRISAVRVCANLINACWPAFLATCSTFLNSALDSTFYHNLVRAFQKMTQVSGVLELSTPRDAFLTSLGKAATPINTYSLANQPSREAQVTGEDLSADEKMAAQTPVSATTRQSLDVNKPSLSIRNLLCMRALLNLGVALGPTLNSDSWFILIETLLHVEFLMTSQSRRPSSGGSQAVVAEIESGETRTSMGAEAVAVRNASKRMFESTRGYSDEAFSIVIHALFRISGPLRTDASTTEPATIKALNGSGQRREGRGHQASRSMSGLWKTGQQQDQEAAFVLSKLGDLARTNIHRFTSVSSEQVSWSLVGIYLHDTVTSYGATSRLRLKAAKILNTIVAESINLLSADDADGAEFGNLREKALSTLAAQIRSLERLNLSQRQEERATDDEIHAEMLGTLESIIGQNGESLGPVWSIVFRLLRSTFRYTTDEAVARQQVRVLPLSMVQALSPDILQVAFRSLQLVVSDFLSLFDLPSLVELTDVLTLFGLQTNDLNISLTTSNLFGSVASLLQEKLSVIDISEDFREQDLNHLVKNRDADEAVGAVWMFLISRLGSLCLDGRQDVRTSALRMILRILEASGSKQTGAAWNVLLQKVFLKNLDGFHEMVVSQSSDAQKWQTSITQLLAGLADIVVRNLRIITEERGFSRTSEKLFTTLETLLVQKSLAVWAVVFATTSKLLDALRQNGIGSVSFATSALRLFLAHHPADMFGDFHNDSTKLPDNQSEPNQESFVQHAGVFAEVFLSFQDCSEAESAMRTIDTLKVVKSLRATIFQCTHPPYTSDIRTLAPEQERVVIILPLLRHLMQGQRSEFSLCLLDFVQAALSRANQPTVPATATKGGKPAQTPTFVAFSSKCVEILDLMTSTFPADDDVFEDLSVSTSVVALAAILNSKYSALPQNPDSPLSQVAGRTANNLIATTTRHVTKSPRNFSPIQLTAFFTAVSTAAAAILNANGLDTLSSTPPPAKILADEAFDISTFQALHDSIIPTFGTAAISNELRKTYIISLFHASLVAKPWLFDMPDDLVNNPLENFSTVRMGTVCEPVFPHRQRICYTALDALFGLVAKRVDTTANESSAIKKQRMTLATIAAPYLLLRVAHAFKTFMADQPLRSLTPLPRPLRIELLKLLSKCLELWSEDGAFEAWSKGASDVNVSDGKTHLRILYPMVLRLQEKWAWCPRLSGGGAWQEGVEGRGIEAKMKEWGSAVAGNWDVIG